MTYKLPPLPEASNDNRKYGRAGFHASNGPVYTAEQMQAYAIAAIEAQGVPDIDALTDAIAEGLKGTYHCTRVWEAWRVGTMGQDDFEPVDESDTPREIAETVIAMLASAPPAQQSETQDDNSPSDLDYSPQGPGVDGFAPQADMRIPDAVEHYGGVKSDEELFPTQASEVQQEPTDEQIMATVGRKGFGFSDSRPLGQQWDQVCELIRAVVRERYNHPAQQAKPHPLSDVRDAQAMYKHPDLPTLREVFKDGWNCAEAARGIKE